MWWSTEHALAPNTETVALENLVAGLLVVTLLSMAVTMKRHVVVSLGVNSETHHELPTNCASSGEIMDEADSYEKTFLNHTSRAGVTHGTYSRQSCNRMTMPQKGRFLALSQMTNRRC